MPVNLLNEKDLNAYLTDLVYQGSPVPSFKKEELSNSDFVEKHLDQVINAVLSQYFKHRLRTYLVKDEEHPFLIPVKKSDDLPNWAKSALDKGDKVFLFQSNLVPNDLFEKITTIKDYLYSITKANLEKKIATARNTQKPVKLTLDFLKTNNEFQDFEKTYEIAQNWHHVLAKQNNSQQKIQSLKQDSLSGTQEIMRLDNGMRIVKLTTPEALDYESAIMGHCVGKGSYDEGVKEGRIEIYSLRDANNEPHVTFEVRNNGVYQCKGKQNNRPASKYISYVQQFITAKQFALVQDVKNTCLIYQDGQYYDIFNLPKRFVIKGDLDLSKMELTQLPDLSTIIVEGNFYCSNNLLTSLKGAPQIIKGNFDCSHNKITSLEGVSQNLSRSFNCSNNELTSLEGAPQNIEGNFDCSNNKITSLEKSPQEIKGNFVCSNNKIMSLEKSPQKIKGNFVCSNNPITSLKGGPKEVGGDYYCCSCNLINLIGLPQIINGSVDCSHNENLISFKGAPREVKFWNCSYCPKINNLIGSPQLVRLGFDCSHNENLMSFEGAPKKVTGVFNCSHCPKIKSLVGMSQIVDSFICSNNLNLMSFEGAPEKVGSWNCSYCPKINNLVGAPQIVEGHFDCSHNENLMSFEGAPKKVKGWDCSYCPKIKSLVGMPQIVDGYFDCSNNVKLTSLIGGPQKVSYDYRCDKCGLSNLIGSPQIVGGDFNCSSNLSLISFEGVSEKIKGNFICLGSSFERFDCETQEFLHRFIVSSPNIKSLAGFPLHVSDTLSVEDLSVEDKMDFLYDLPTKTSYVKTNVPHLFQKMREELEQKATSSELKQPTDNSRLFKFFSSIRSAFK